VDPRRGQRWIIDATPDFPRQLAELDRLAPVAESPGLSGIFLTHAHIGHYTGLMHLGRETMGARGIPVHAMPRMRAFLEGNGPWAQLPERGHVQLRPLSADVAVPLGPELRVTPIPVPHRDEYSETVAFRIEGPARSVLYLPDIDAWDRWDRRLEDELRLVDVAWLDGTFYESGELPHRDDAEVPHPPIVSTMEALGALAPELRARVRFIHLNHTNPALRPDGLARRRIVEAGFALAQEGEIVALAGPGGAASIGERGAPGGRGGGAGRATTGELASAGIGGASGGMSRRNHRGADPNPPAPGFDLAGSDPRAVEIADRVMEAMGGRRAWDATRYVTWRFFGARRHLWDRHSGDVRIEGTDRDTGRPFVILMNIHTRTGGAWVGGEVVQDSAERARWLDHGEAWWINDGYWLFAPYKLKDTGVTLRCAGEAVTLDGAAADVLELTFEGVGRTPRNRYLMYVGRASGLIEQWDFYADRSDAEPAFRCPWRGWRRYGRIMLSGDRGELRGRPARLEEIAVLQTLPAGALESPEPLDWAKLVAGGDS
jgi:pyrroloquinoline quinone biosynthesis protein B